MKRLFESLSVLVLIFVGFCFLQTLFNVNAALSGYFCLNEEKYGVETLDGVAFEESDCNYVCIRGK